MTREFSNEIERHIAGATVSHAGPFSSIEVPELVKPLPCELREKWVVPFYRASLIRGAGEFAESLRSITDEVTPALLTTLLSDFNWRPRITAAYFAAILVEDSVEEHIGKLLLRSDVCFAGNGYCLALARFNSPKSLDFLRRYLAYYLLKPSLHFNQGEAIGAMAYLDRVNGTAHLDEFADRWQQYEQASGAFGLQKHIQRFDVQFSAVVRIAREIGK